MHAVAFAMCSVSVSVHCRNLYIHHSLFIPKWIYYMHTVLASCMGVNWPFWLFQLQILTELKDSDMIIFDPQLRLNASQQIPSGRSEAQKDQKLFVNSCWGPCRHPWGSTVMLMSVRPVLTVGGGSSWHQSFPVNGVNSEEMGSSLWRRQSCMNDS